METTPLPYGLKSSYRNLMSENSQDHAQKPQRNCTLMNSASGHARTKSVFGHAVLRIQIR
jgi:hypothetical protein